MGQIRPDSILKPETKIFLAGYRGMVGAVILRNLKEKWFGNVVTQARQKLDLLDQSAAHRFFRGAHVDYLVLATARVGGIVANNTCPAEFIY